MSTVEFLVVDDEPDIRLVLQLNLEHWGYRCRTAGSASEAFAACAERRPDVALLDLSLPGEGGLELLARLNEAGIAPRAVALLSAVPESDLAGRASRAGVEHLAKPFSLDDLRELSDRLARMSS